MKHTVLLVDDDENVLRGLSRALRQQPYQLYTARSGEEAVDVLKAHAVDVIVTDDRMPGMSGSDLLAWIAENCPEVMRIVLTGHASAETAIRAINESSVYHFFTKPCNDFHLAMAIRKALEHKDLLEEHHRLLEINKRMSTDPQHLGRDLVKVSRMAVKGIQEPLREILRQSHESSSTGDQNMDTAARQSLQQATGAAEEIDRLVNGLLARS